MLDKQLQELVAATGEILDLDDSVIEKDYYVTQVIQTLSTVENDYFRLVFWRIDSLKLDGICVTAVTREAGDNFKITGTIPGGGNRATRELHFNKDGGFTRSGGNTDLSPEHITMKDNLSAIFKHFKHTLAPETQIIFAVQFALAEYKPTAPTTFKFAFFPQISFGASAESIAFVKNVREILADQSLSDKDMAGRIQLEINKTNGSGALHLILEKYELCKNAAAAAASAPTQGRQG